MDIFNSINSINDIDWASFWQKQVQHTYKTQNSGFWDDWARKIKPKAKHSRYVEMLLPLIHIDPEDTVMDVGTGTGALTIPLAKIALKVYGVDLSAEALKVVMAQAEEENLNNITPIQGDWIKLEPKDLPRCDVAIASRSIPGGSDIKRSIWLMNEVALKSCHITWRVRGNDPLDRQISEIMNIDIDYSPEHAILYNVIEGMGIHPDVRTFTLKREKEFSSLEDAFFQIVRSRDIDTPTSKKVMELLDEKLEKRDGYLYQKKDTTWVLFSWNK